MSHESSKEFWKSKHFESIRAVLLLRCQNQLGWEISLICYWNINSLRQKFSFGYRIHSMRTISLRASIMSCLIMWSSEFWQPRMKPGHIFKTAIFSKFFRAFTGHLVGQNTGKKNQSFFELFTNKTFEKAFVLFISDKSLCTLGCPTNGYILLSTMHSIQACILVY